MPEKEKSSFEGKYILYDPSSGELQHDTWVKASLGYINRIALEHDHPDQTYNYVKPYLAKLGLTPEEFNIEKPLSELEFNLKEDSLERFKGLSRDQLILKIIELETFLDDYY